MKRIDIHLVITFPILLFLFNQCRSSGDNAIPDNTDAGITISTVHCLSDSTQTYVVARPETFNKGRYYPVVFVFDPHGNGNLAVNTFRAGASEFGYIIAGSNIIRNGYDSIEYALQSIIRDVKSRYPVDTKRLYAAGFSGGGRVAQHFSQISTEIASIAVMGAGYSLDQHTLLRNKPSMLFIIGNEDFNYMEVMNTESILSANAIRYYVLEYPGKHAWPGDKIIHDALYWFEFDACRKGTATSKRLFIDNFKALVQQQVNLFEENDDVSGVVRSLEKGIIFLSEIARTKNWQRMLEDAKEKSDYRQAMKQKQVARQLEMRLRQGYVAAFQDKDTLWWKNEINGLNERIGHSENVYLQPVYKRVKNFISIVAYSFSNNALIEHNLENAEKYVALYEVVDPGNADVYFFKAWLYSEEGQVGKAVRYYKKAIELGFSDHKKAVRELPVEVTAGT